MLRYVTIALSIATVSLGVSAETSKEVLRSAETTSPQKKQFKDDWPILVPGGGGERTREPFVLGSHHGKRIDYLVPIIHRYFEPKSLTGGAKVKVMLHKADSPVYEFLMNTGKETDAFYCEEAIWAASPYAKVAERLTQSPCSFTSKDSEDSVFSCKDLFFQEYPELKERVVVTHIIPASAEDLFKHVVNTTELHSLRNLRTIKISDLNSNLLQEFREDWHKFLIEHTWDKRLQPATKGGATRAELLEYANNLVEKYHSLFVQ